MEVYFKNMTVEEGTKEKIAHDLRTLAQDIKQVAVTSSQRLGEEAVAGAKATGRIARQHPYSAMVIAFGVGVLVGLWVNRE